MTTLAPKLPYNHQFAGGYPRVGGQPTPTDPDAIDYLERVAAADGAAVEVGVAMAVDAFIKGCKSDSAGYAGDPTRTVWDALQACCIMCGARTISGALVPLVGAAPTPYNFASGDYSRGGSTPGLKGDGVGKWIDTNRANNADGLNDKHLATYRTSAPAVTSVYAGSLQGSPTSATQQYADAVNDTVDFYINSSAGKLVADTGSTNFVGTSLLDGTLSVRSNGASSTRTLTPVAHSLSTFVFGRNVDGAVSNRTDARLAFYSIGSALDLALLDARVTTLVSEIAAAIP